MSVLPSMGNKTRVALLTALANGLSGQDASSLYSGYQDQVAQAQAARQDYLSGLDQLITTQAQAGMSGDQAQMLLRSQRIAAGLPPDSPISQQARAILQNAYPDTGNRISQMPGGLSPLASAEAAHGVDFNDVQDINASVKDLMSQGVTNLHDITMNIVGKARAGFGYDTMTVPGNPDPKTGQQTEQTIQVSQMPADTQATMRSLVERAYNYYTDRLPPPSDTGPPGGGGGGAPILVSQNSGPGGYKAETPVAYSSAATGPAGFFPGSGGAGGATGAMSNTTVTGQGTTYPNVGAQDPGMFAYDPGTSSGGFSPMDFLGNLVSGRVFGGQFQ